MLRNIGIPFANIKQISFSSAVIIMYNTRSKAFLLLTARTGWSLCLCLLSEGKPECRRGVETEMGRDEKQKEKEKMEVQTGDL